jgi:hypothetical protein
MFKLRCICDANFYVICDSDRVGEETEANGDHCGDRTLHRTRSRFDRTRPVSSQGLSSPRMLGFSTGTSGSSRNRSVRSGT